MAEPVVPQSSAPRSRSAPGQDVWARAALANARQVAVVLLGLAGLFLAGWAGLLLAGARPVGWGQLLLIGTVVVAVAMLIEGTRRLALLHTSRKLLPAGWQSVDAHWVGGPQLRGRRLLVLSEDGAVCLRVRDSSRHAERAIDARGRVWMLRPAADGRTAIMIEQVPEILLARVTTWHPV